LAVARVDEPRCGTRGAGFDGLPATTKAGKPRKRNAYPATCAACGHQLAPGEGVIERNRACAWTAFCVEPLFRATR
jgi:hypothetical protein